MAGVSTRLVNDLVFYGFLLGAGVLFLLGSSIYIPALRPASGGSSDSSALRNIQDQINKLSSKPFSINYITPPAAPKAPAPSSRSSYKVPTPAKATTSPNCTNSSGYTIWKGNGCVNGKQVYNVAAEVKGTGLCSAARTEFLRRYKC